MPVPELDIKKIYDQEEEQEEYRVWCQKFPASEISLQMIDNILNTIRQVPRHWVPRWIKEWAEEYPKRVIDIEECRKIGKTFRFLMSEAITHNREEDR